MCVCVCVCVCVCGGGYISFNTLSFIFFYFSQLTLKMSENVAKRTEFGSENSDILA